LKELWRAGNQLYPLPAVMVSIGDSPETYNIITIAWVGTICSDPAMVYISVRPNRYSHSIIERTGEFVINLTNKQLSYATDWCGVKSGRNVNKFEQMHLTPEPSAMIKAPAIAESPLSIECRVKQKISLGTHDMFIAEVLCVQANEKYIDPKTGTFDLAKANPICYSHGKYYEVGAEIGKFGFSVQKKKNLNGKRQNKNRPQQ